MPIRFTKAGRFLNGFDSCSYRNELFLLFMEVFSIIQFRLTPCTGPVLNGGAFQSLELNAEFEIGSGYYKAY